MDPDFMTRYLPEHGAPRDTDHGAPGNEPGIGEPSVPEPGADLAAPPQRAEETTAVLPPDAPTAAGYAARPAPTAPQPPQAPQQPPAPRPEATDPDPDGRTTPVGWTARPAAGPAARPDTGAPHTDAPQRIAPMNYRATRFTAPPPRPAWSTPPGPDTPASAALQPAAAPHWHASEPIPATAPFTPSAPALALRPDELVKQRKVPPEMGWRKGVYVGTGHLVNLGPGPDERALREQIDAIGSNIPGNYTIAVVSIKGGVGKTRTTACLGTVYATYRTEPVLAIDANPTYGSLGRVVDAQATASIREYLADEQVATYPKARSYTGKNRQGLEVLPGNQNVASPLPVTGDLFTETLHSTQRFYQLTLVDCGNHIEHSVMRGVLDAADALVIVGTMNYDGAEAAERTLDWLTARDLHPLLRRSALVLNDINRCFNGDFYEKVRERLEPRVGAMSAIPFDKHLRDGAELDFDALRTPTRRAYIQLAAWLAQGFAAPRAGAR